MTAYLISLNFCNLKVKTIPFCHTFAMDYISCNHDNKSSIISLPTAKSDLQLNCRVILTLT
jgi:hypothetical protein